MSSFACTPISSRRAARLAGLLALLFVLCLGGARAEAMPVPGATPSIWSDQADYRPGSTVTLGGSGWGPGESVHIRVNDDAGSTWSRDVDVTAADNGDISDSFSLPDWFVAQYSVTATGASGAVAMTSFTDGNLSFALATTPDQAAPSNLNWKVTWDHFSDSACGTRDAGGTTNYIGNTVQANNSEPQVGAKQSARPTAAVDNGGSYVLNYWSTAATSTTPATTAQLCDATNGNVTYYAHFKLAQQATALTVQDASGTYGGTTSLSATLTSGGSAVSGKTIAFTVKGANVGTATTNSAGVATKSGVDLTGISAGTYTGGVSASFAADPNFLASSANGSLTVSPRSVTGSFTAADKTYDGNTTAAITGRSLAGAVSGDDVSLSGGTATFGDKNVGQGKAVSGTGFALTGAAKANYTLGSVSNTTASITAKALTGSFSAADKVYDGTTTASISGRSLAGVVGSEDVTLSGGSASFATKDVGAAKDVSGTGFALGGADKGNYTLGSVADTTASIAPKEITGSFTAADKVYDGNTDAAITGRSLGGAVDGDSVSLTGGSASFDTRAAGKDKSVSGSGFGLAGDDKGDYTLKSADLATTASITPKEITGSFTAADKVYDGTTDATVATRSLNGVVGDDKVSLTGGTASFATKDVGQDKAVAGAGFYLGGDDKGDYTLKSSSLATTASITPLALIGHFSAADKVYDGNRDATITGRTLTGVLPGETVTLTGGSASFATKDAGTDETVSGSGFGLDGTDKGNYSLASVTDTTASITPKEITGSFTAADKVYDGTTDAAITGRSLNGAVTDDKVELAGGTAQFGTKDAGQGKTVTGSGFGLTGDDKGDYTLKSSDLATTASITPLALIGHFSAADKVYDGNRDATITGRTLTGVVGTEDVTLTGGGASFDTKDVGAAKAVSGTGFALGGADKGNYSLASSSLTTKAAITAKPLTGHFTAADKVYDGNAEATITGRSLDGVVGTEDVALTGGTAQFDTKDAGKDKTVSGSGFDLGGTDKGNYSLGSVTDATASITPKQITGSFTAADKVYDGTTDATVATRSLAGVIDGDKVSLTGGTAQFDTKDVGQDKAVDGTGFDLGGDDKGDYTLKSAGLSTTASIMPLEITGSFKAADKVYDGTTDATISDRALSGKVTGDDVRLDGGTASFDTKGVGQDKAVSGSGFSLAGDNKGDYTLKSSSLATTASITPKALTGHFAAADKVYDGNRGATIVGRSLDGVVGSEDVTLTGGTAQFDTKDAGQDKPVGGSGFDLAGDDKGNYTLASVTDAKANITAKALTGHFTAADKVYDGTTDATITSATLDGVVGTEDVTLTGGTAQFDTKDAGQDKTVSGSGFGLGGTDKGNYTLASVSDTQASITPKQITGSFTAADKVYDGNRDATITGRSLNGDVTGDKVSLVDGAAQFDTRNAGKDKAVSGSGFALAGDDKGDYTLASSDLATTATITAKPLSGSFTAADKVYDGNRDAKITGSSLGAGVVDGDDVTLDASGAGAQFGSKSAGQAKTVTGSGFALAGADEANYALSMNTASASITPKPIAGGFTAADKVYDGTTAATITGRSLAGTITGDDVSLSGGMAAFGTKNAGQGKTVSGSGFTLAGADKDNYTLGAVSPATATITPKSITGSFTAADKVYDGTTAATITSRSLSGQIAGDDVSLSGGTATFADANVGQSKPVGGSGFTLAGADKDDYTLASVAGTTASITYAPASMSCLGAPGRTILQPINTDGTSVFKQGSTVPAKFRVCDASGNSVGTAGVVTSFRLTQTISGTLATAVNELVDSTTPGTDFRWSATDQQWVFNMSTKSLTAGRTYVYTVTLNDGTSFQFKFGLK